MLLRQQRRKEYLTSRLWDLHGTRFSSRHSKRSSQKMKLPAPKGGVSEEGELSVLMELLINPSLLLDVVPYCGLIPMLTYCAGIIPIGPKLSTPQLFLDMRTQAKYLPRCDTFYYRYQLRDAVRRNRLHQKMDVVLIRAYLLKFYLVTLLYLETNIPQHLIHSSIKHHPSIFCRKHHMIQQHRYIMALMDILAHASTLRPKERGINPGVIKVVMLPRQGPGPQDNALLPRGEPRGTSRIFILVGVSRQWRCSIPIRLLYPSGRA